jgi:hypothetical protein
VLLYSKCVHYSPKYVQVYHTGFCHINATSRKLNDRFSEQDKEEPSQAIEGNYEKIRLIMPEQEKSKAKSKPILLEIGNIGCLENYLV